MTGSKVKVLIYMNTLNQKQRISQSADLMKIMGTHSRLQILCYLCTNGPTSVSDLTEYLQLEQSTTSHQLARLRREKLVTTSRQGSEIYYSLTNNPKSELAKSIIKQCGCVK